MKRRGMVAALTLAAALQAQSVRIALVGDSTVNDEGGWGPGFKESFTSAVQVTNYAMNGRSSTSFRAEGRWEPVLAGHPDYVLIQFGHNDGPGKGPDRETDPATTYRANMLRYAEEATAAGATPVFVTSIVRRRFDAGGKIVRDSLVPYVEEVRRLAAEKKIALIDLYALTLEQSEKLGPDGAAELGARDKDGKLDTTHLSPKGRIAMGIIAAQALVRLFPALNPYLVAH